MCKQLKVVHEKQMVVSHTVVGVPNSISSSWLCSNLVGGCIANTNSNNEKHLIKGFPLTAECFLVRLCTSRLDILEGYLGRGRFVLLVSARLRF